MTTFFPPLGLERGVAAKDDLYKNFFYFSGGGGGGGGIASPTTLPLDLPMDHRGTVAGSWCSSQ